MSSAHECRHRTSSDLPGLHERARTQIISGFLLSFLHTSHRIGQIFPLLGLSGEQQILWICYYKVVYGFLFECFD